MTDKDFWLIVRRALLMIVKAIERKYPAREEILDTGGNASVSFLVDD
jgi:hypothetical protein